MALKTVDLGPVSSYAIAVSKGYTGTEQEWYELIHNVTTDAQSAADSAASAARDAAAAAQSLIDIGTAKTAAIGEIQDEGTAQKGIVTAEGTTQVGNVQDAKTLAVAAVQAQQGTSVQAVYDKGTEQVTAVGSEGNTQIGLVTAEGTEQVGLVEAKGQEVLESIPEDYSSLVTQANNTQFALENTKILPYNYIKYLSGGQIDTSTNKWADVGSRTKRFSVMPVKAGDSLVIKANATLDAQVAILKSYDGEQEPGDTPDFSTATGWTAVKTITAGTTFTETVPSDAVYLYCYLGTISGSTAPASILIGGYDFTKNLYTNISEIEGEVGDLKSAFAQCGITLTPTWTDGKYVAGDNVVIDNDNYSIADFNVTNLQGDVLISTYGASTVGWILLDANNAKIERSLFTNSTGITYNFQRTVTIPQNGVLLRVSCAKSLKSSQNVTYLVEGNDFLPCVANATTIFDSVRKFSAYSVEVSNLTASTNKVPYDNFHGTIITTGKIDASQQQLALSYDQRMFIRRKFNTWSAWKEMAIGTPASASASTDFNSQTNPFFYCGVSGLTVATNHVPYDGFNGCVYNIDYGGNFGSQVAVSSNGDMYYRRKYVSWGDWVKVAKANQVEALENDYCILSEFANIFCAGDSLTWGAVYTGSGSSDYRAAKKPYNDVLALRTGSTVARNAQPGIDAIGYVSKLSSITEKTNQLCIIYLGVNGGLTDTIDTDAPGDDKSEYDLTTETGSYCYIVKHCLDANAKVLLVKIYAGGGTNGVSTTNTVIGKVAEKFGVAVIDNESLPQKYHIWPNGQGYDSTHLNDFGYAAFAEYLIRQVNQLEPTMLARLLPDS